ncbi:MAG: P-loop NTPase [Elusimicrobia bacterium]|nr:P-loop NTPase [Elusimicrobiota bacterium]
MKQLVIISGKGGTGKTTLAASFFSLAGGDCVAVDCDVDAADMHILLEPEIIASHDFYSGKTAFINPSLCISCGKCREICRFEAINETFNVDIYSCEGCAFCAKVCPVSAVEMKERISGKWFFSKTVYGHLIHARLEPGSENSGKLVSRVKKEAVETAVKEKKRLIIVDGPPGTGCPLMASLSSADLAVIITEPTLSGIHDMKRVFETASSFKIPCAAVINKWDINADNCQEIENYCNSNKIKVLGRIPFDKSVEKAIENMRPLVKYGSSAAAEEIRKIWDKVREIIFIGETDEQR